MSWKKSVLMGLLVLGALCLGRTVQAADGLKGTVYIAGHGGHLAVVDLATLRPPTDVEKDRIVLTEAGSEMEGKVAGQNFEAIKTGGGSHGSAIINGKLYAGLLNGKVVVVDLKTRKREKTLQVGQKFCDAVLGPGGNIYFEDMADGNVYIFDPKKMKTVDKVPIGAAVCSITWTNGVKTAYVSDMPVGVVHVVDWKTKKVVKDIKDPGMTFIHQMRMAPDGRHLWVAAANEFGPGLSARTQKPQIVIIDTKTDAVVDHIVMPDDMSLHDVKFTPDGKTALIAARTYGDDSVLALMDMKSREIKKRVSVCASCHKPLGLTVSIDKGSPLLCGMAINWK